ncbi:DUF3472 domain-containing protein [Spirulina sp. 06S082]|uniref:DUF3472 domain-containing protein n=1 Tax=Spirulina sp. 06S082 TaxID=3110248 RepID=UPI002B204804|nr:DUF3472 domain-containing protein [Spirulina sp. 06S082]MEA5468898.1 DUF3472 domain-containing protein [Spirulina sp. 06S082]
MKRLISVFFVFVMLIVAAATPTPEAASANPIATANPASDVSSASTRMNPLTTKLGQITHSSLPKNPAKTPQTGSLTLGAPNILYSIPNKPTSGFDAIKFSMRPMTEKSNNQNRLAYYWAYQDNLVSANNNAFYFGLQREGEYGKTALFSVFGNGTSSASGDQYCQAGADSGLGTNCHIPYSWSVNHDYDFMVTLHDLNSTHATWEGSIYDHSTQQTQSIGKITVALNSNQEAAIASSSPVAFDEYFDWSEHSADQRPLSTILYFTPTGYYQGQAYPGKVSRLSFGNQDNNAVTHFYSDLKQYVYITQGN